MSSPHGAPRREHRGEPPPALLVSCLGGFLTLWIQTCAAGTARASATSLDPATNSCECDGCGDEGLDAGKIRIAGIFDTVGFFWGEEIFHLVVDMINNRTDGWHDDLFADGAELEAVVANAMCDPDVAVGEYWDLRPLHGLVGCRCSGASLAVARIAGLESVPQVSMSSTSSKLSDVGRFPTFFRTIAPTDHRGDAGALVALFREFGWDRVSIINTDKQYTKDLATDFAAAWVGDHGGPIPWTGQVAHSHTIKLNANDTLDEQSLQQAFDGIPSGDPSVNSRVILLLAHNQHSFEIIKRAQQSSNVHPDTIWVGPDGWANRLPGDTSWMPEAPGYMGIVPHQNRDAVYDDFMARLRAAQRAAGRVVTEELPDTFAWHLVDSVLALAMALSSVPPEQRSDGRAVVSALRNVSFQGVSGRVEFTAEGDRRNPVYDVVNFPDRDGRWRTTGSIALNPDGADVSVDVPGMCWAVDGCNLRHPPPDKYPVPPAPITFPIWAVGIVAPTFVLSLVGFLLYRRRKIGRSREQKRTIEARDAELSAFRDSLVGMRTARSQHVPKLPSAGLPQIVWCWRETVRFMSARDASLVFGDPSQCWIKYDADANARLEAAFQDQRGRGKVSPLPGYEVDFEKMKQTKLETGFQREVQRAIVPAPIEEAAVVDNFHLDGPGRELGEELPAELVAEPQLVLATGDVLQIAKQRSDGWAFGSVVSHKDEEQPQTLKRQALGGVDKLTDATLISTETGWFPLKATATPTAEDLAILQKNLGAVGAGTLDPPADWERIADPTVVQRHILPEGCDEREEVVKAFLSTLKGPVTVLQVERIQNLAMWQTYVVKRQTICSRDAGADAAPDSDAARRALGRFERRWLWHATNSEAIPKILQQGFNRSFCGKHATMHGKGVYFARDAAYSARDTYAQPDDDGTRYMMACRVVTGEYCKGKKDALTPDLRDATNNILYDSTVGLLRGDTMANPSIYVTYHDAQAYAEYLISFKRV